MEVDRAMVLGDALAEMRDEPGMIGQLAEVVLAARIWDRERKLWRYKQSPHVLTQAETRLARAVERLWPAPKQEVVRDSQ